MSISQLAEQTFVRTKVFNVQKPNTFSYVMALADTGCGTEMPVMRADVYRKINKDAPIKSVNIDAGGADDSPLEILGRAASAIRVQIYNAEGQKINYECKPLICNNLKLPFILGAGDMGKLDLVPYIKNKYATLNYKGTKLTVPLCRLKDRKLPRRTIYELTAKKNVTIKPFSEMVIDGIVDTPKGDVGQVTMFDPDEEYMQNQGLYVASSIDTLKQGGQVKVMVMNLNSSPISVNKHTKIGELFYCREKDGRLFTEGAYDKLTIKPKRRRVLRIQTKPQTRPESLTEIVKRNKKKDGEIPPMTPDQLFKKIAEDLKLDQCELLSPKEKDEIINLFVAYSDILALKYRDIGNCKLFEVEIDTGDADPVKSRMRPAPHHLKEDLRKQLVRWLEQDVIEESNADWGSAMRPVPKPDGSTRWCVDFRGLNKVTKPQLRPVANLQDKLQSLKAGKRPIKYYTTLDLSEAFHSLSLEPTARDKTTFLTEFGAFKFKKMPFGLSIAPSAFSHVITALEHGLNEKDPELTRRTLCYFDDIILASENFQELYYSLESVFKQIRKLGLKIKPSKVELAKTEVSWLGHRITPQGVKLDPKRTESLKNWPEVTTQKMARGLNGFMNCFRSFIRGYASRTTNIRKLSSMKNPVWTKECQAELEDIVQAASEDPILRHPDFSKGANPFIVTVDSSGTGTGMTLSQKQSLTLPDNKVEDREVIITYGSRRKEDSERHYGSYKSELKGIVDAVVGHKEYLWGRKFIVRTDHKGLEFIRNPNNDKMPALAQRWQEHLSPFQFDLEYVPATKLKLVDALSRRPYKHDNWGNLPPAPIRDETFPFNDLTEEEANDTNPEVWIPYLKRNFSEQFKRLSDKSKENPESSMKVTKKGAPLPSRFLTPRSRSTSRNG